MTTPATPPAPTTTPPDPAASPDGSGGDSGQGDIAVVLMVPTDAAQSLPGQQGDGTAEGGAPPVFLTLAYLRKPSTMDSAAFFIAVLTAARDSATAGQPINGQINGLGRTSYSGSEDEFFALVESPDIEPLRTALMSGVNSSAASDESSQPADGSPPNQIVDPGIYLPKIVLSTLDAGAELPVQRIEPVATSFDTLTLVQDGTMMDVPLGAPASSPDVPANPADPTSAAPPDSTAPAALDAKAGGPPITRGSYVSVGNQRGRVDLVVTSGKVPGVESDIEGSKDNPALRVVVYTESDGKWKATGKRIATRANSAKRVAPLMHRPASKDAGYAALVGLQADHESKVAEAGSPVGALPDGDALMSVYDRGIEAWPGEERTTASAHDWAIGRVKAFLSTCVGQRPDGYVRDDDLLPAGHPETKRAPEPDASAVLLDVAEVKARIESQRAVGATS